MIFQKSIPVFACIYIFLAFSLFAADDSKAPEPSPFSVQMHTLSGKNFERHKRSVDMISAAGIKQVRDECFWHIVEREKGVYVIPEHVLRNLDYSIDAGLETLIILNYANDLYDEGMAPTSDEAIKAFGEYCFTMARRLKGKVHYFEVWNEPNADGFWKPKADPAAYAKLLKTAYKKIKQGNPDALVLGISLAGLDRDFLRTAVENEAYDYMDAMSLHPYCHPRTPEQAGIFNDMDQIRENLKQYGEAKDIWITEIGWPTNVGGGVPEFEQAVRIVRMYLHSMSIPYIPTVFIYWFGPDGPDEEWAEDRFGMIRQDWSPKPSYTSYQNLTQHLNGAEECRFVMKNERGARITVFENNSDFIYAVWGFNDYASFSGKTGSPAEVVNLLGGEYTLRPFQGEIFVRAGVMPVLVKSKNKIEWTQIPERGVALNFEGESRQIPRGQTRTVTFTLPEKLENSAPVTIRGKKKDIFFQKGKQDFRIEVSPEADKGIARFVTLLSPRGTPAPCVYAASEFEVAEPLEIYVSPLPPRKNPRNFMVNVKNISGQNQSGRIFVSPPDGVKLDRSEYEIKDLAPGSKTSSRFGVSSKQDADDIYVVQVEAKLDSGVTVQYEKLISFYECMRAEKEPVIDGDLSDWPANAKGIMLGKPEQYIAGYVDWEGPEDCFTRVYTAWDDEWLYLGVERQDDRLSSPCAGFTVYNNDGIEIYMDTEHEADWKQNRYSDDDHQYGFSLEQGGAIVYSWSQLNNYSRDSRIALKIDPEAEETFSGESFKGCIMEGAIPLDELKIKPHDGMIMGFNIGATDDDDPRTLHPFFQEKHFSWSLRKNSYQNPHSFADLFFVDPSDKTSSLIPRKQNSDSFFFPSGSGLMERTSLASGN